MEGRGENGEIRIRCVKGQERKINGQENEWESAANSGEEVGGISRTRDLR